MNCSTELIAKMLKEKLKLGFLMRKKPIKKKISVEEVIESLKKMGIKRGDSILVHSSLSHINGSAEDLVNELKKLIGPDGNILMPTHPKLEEINGKMYYNPNTCKSGVGYLTEYFRKLPDVQRSLHPFSSVAVWGKDSEWFLANNISGFSPLPHGVNSPYYKLCEKYGKVVCIGVTAQSRATISHVPEEFLDEKYPVKVAEEAEVVIQDNNIKKTKKFRRTKLSFSKIYKCKSQLEKDWLRWNVLQKYQIESTPIEVLDAKACVDLMVNKVQKSGETVYPFAPNVYDRVKTKIRGRILYVSKESQYLAKGHQIYKSTDNGLKWEPYIALPVTLIDKLIMNLPLLSRLFRKSIHHLTLYDDKILVLANRNSYLYKNKFIENINKIHGSRPMVLCTTNNNEIYFGEYRSNKERDNVNIWKFNKQTYKWETAWIFKDVRHIHGVFYDEFDDSIWVTTGDENTEAGIWKSYDNFLSLTKVVGGSQQVRAVQLLFDEKYVYFGSDTPNEKNHIYRMDKASYEIEKLIEVGSSIFYGVKLHNSFFFSTAIEPSNCNKTKFAELWRSDNGVDWYLYKKFKKDIFSMKYFQYGQIYFPNYLGSNHDLYFTPFATKDSMYTYKSPINQQSNNVNITLTKNFEKVNELFVVPFK